MISAYNVSWLYIAVSFFEFARAVYAHSAMLCKTGLFRSKSEI